MGAKWTVKEGRAVGKDAVLQGSQRRDAAEQIKGEQYQASWIWRDSGSEGPQEAGISKSAANWGEPKILCVDSFTVTRQKRCAIVGSEGEDTCG